ncbi:MAG: FadR/GntR family transcriptional regulator [Actinomycetota bacterium]
MATKAVRPFTAIQRIDRTEHVRRQLETALRRGDYGPGDQLPSERKLGEMFGVSRVSVREAVSALKAVGLVHVQQGRGCFVSAPQEEGYAGSFTRWLEAHSEEVMELLAVRGALDELAAGYAAEHAGSLELKAIKAAHVSFAKAAKNPSVDIDTLERLDITFHESLAAAGKNSLLADLLHDLNHHLSTSRRAALSLESRRTKSANEHLRILEAVQAKRPDQARTRARKHLDATRRILEEMTDKSA